MYGEKIEDINRRTYLEGLKKYKNRGIPVKIDGRELPEEEWPRIFEVQEDGGFYMGDFVSEPAGPEDGPEDSAAARRLVEIRFDKVYNK